MVRPSQRRPQAAARRRFDGALIAAIPSIADMTAPRVSVNRRIIRKVLNNWMGKNMKKRSIGSIVAVAAMSLGIVLSGASAATAATSDCHANEFCTWNAGAYSGLPDQYFIGAPALGTQVNVPDNVTSSGISKVQGLGRWYGANQTSVVTSVVVARFYYNVGLNLAGSAADNTIDDVAYLGLNS